MIGVQFDVSSLEARLTGLAGALQDMRPVWGEVHTIFMDFMARVFATEGNYSSERWAPLSPGYAAWKARNYPGRPILQREGTLRASFTHTNAPGHVYRVGPGFMEVGSSLAYARAHHWGYPPRNLPARPIIKPFSKVEGERAADAILAYMLRSMRRGGHPGAVR